MTDSPAMQATTKAIQDQAYETTESLIEARVQAYIAHPEQLDMLERHVIRGEELSLRLVKGARDRVKGLYLCALTTRRPYPGSETILINIRAAARLLARLGDSDLPVREAVKKLQK